MRANPTDALVVDASVAVKWHLADEEFSDQALLVLDRFARGQVVLFAPDYIRYEFPSAITVAIMGKRPRMTSEQSAQAITEFLMLGIKTLSDDELILAAHALALQYGCAFYDALYLALAQRLSVPLITADRKFYQKIQELPHVIWIGDYPGNQPA